ncbi:MAG TPA: DUF5657 family protein [Thermodesulfovibrionia bacterium]|nr:DUF5657 family protein [Thermodesulfovibrionia bacterium]
MPFDTLGPFGSAEVTLIFKIVTLVIVTIYTIFTFVILTQVRVMNRILKEKFPSAVLMFLALGNLVFALSLFLIGLVIL